MPDELHRKKENDKESIDSLYKFFIKGNITLRVKELQNYLLFAPIAFFCE